MIANQMRVSIASILSRVLRRSKADLRALASDEREIAPAAETETLAAIYDPADLDRIKAVQEDTTWERERGRIMAGRAAHAATRLYRLDDAVVQGSFLYLGSRRVPIADTRGLELPSLRRRPTLPSGMLCSYLYTSRFFSHWLTDHLTAELLGRELGLVTYGSARQKHYGHEAAIRETLGLHTQGVESGVFESLWVADDFGQNASKRARYLQLREGLRSGAVPAPSRGAMILRGSSGAKRLLVNEMALAEQLAGLGFRILDPQRDSFETMRNALCEAPLVVGVEGSGLGHAIMLMPRDGCLAVIQPPRRFNNPHKAYTDCLGQRYAFTVADEADGGFHLPSGRLLALFERVARERSESAQPVIEIR